jgi:uncharacterized protein DUF3857
MVPLPNGFRVAVLDLSQRKPKRIGCFTAPRSTFYTAFEHTMGHRRKLSVSCLYTIAGFFLFAFAVQLVPGQESAPKPPDEPAPKSARRAGPPEKVQNPAQIELLETKVRFETNGNSRKEVHAIVKINSELGVRQFARLNFDFNRSFESVDIPLVHITHANGGTADILPGAITDQPNPAVVNAPVYQDVRVKSLRILGLQPGDTLEYRVVRTVSHHPLAPNFWLDHSFDRTGLVTQEIFHLDLPGNLTSTTTIGPEGIWNGVLPVVYATVPWTGFHNTGEGSLVRSVYEWEIPAAWKLPAPMDNQGKSTPDVVVTRFGSWGELVGRLGSHLQSLTDADRIVATDRLRSLDPASKTAESKLRAAYDLISRTLKTVDLPLGVTGFQSRRIAEILDSGYATPEEKCSLLAHFATVAGIKAEIVLVGAPETEKQFARPTPFQHVFVIATEKKKRIALDPSLEVAPFGVISSEFRGKAALSLTLFDGGDFTSASWQPLPTDLPFPASQNVNVDATLTADGGLGAKVHYSMRGDNELVLRVAFHQTAKEKWKEVAQLLSITDGFRGQVTSVNASDPYATKEPFTVDYELEQPKFVDWSKKTVRIPALLPQLGLPDAPAKPASGAATAPIELGTPLEVETQMTLHLPAGTIAQTPTGTSVERDYATYSSQYSAKGSALTASRHIHFLLRQIPGTRAADYNAFLRAVQSDEAQDFSLERPETATPKTNSAAPN